jgi:KRAB domain-containing zinc finger protein
LRPYSCSRCTKAFFTPTGLQKHMMGHNGEKPHMCDKCGKAFVESSSLRTHVRRIHTKEKVSRTKEKNFSVY